MPMVSTPPVGSSSDRHARAPPFFQQPPASSAASLFSQLLKPQQDLLANLVPPQEAAQRLAALLAAASTNGKNGSNSGNDDVDDGKENNSMKVPPISLPSGLPFSPDMLWRYPNPFLPQPPASPLENQMKAQLPGGLGHDPRQWNREDVNMFLRYCEREYDLEKIDMEKFQMNGKALCLLSKSDLAERCAGAGDVIHNILQMLQRETFGLPPSSPRPPLMTPTSPAMPLSPHAWPLLSPSVAAAAADTFPNLSHLISQANSVTLSPAPSIESHSQNGGSPKGAAAAAAAAAAAVSSIHQLYPPPPGHHPTSTSASSSSNNLSVPPPLNNLGRRSQSASSSHSDSEDSTEIKSPTASKIPKSPSAVPTSSSKDGEQPTPELNTNGRLLWDFLQQLLNDSQQRYTSYITWKNKETGVFKIVDPAGLAKLWGIQKNHLSMNYDKMSRALRYYYRVNILRKVQGERHCYQFLRNPTELKSIKNISLLRQQMEQQAAAHKLAAQQVAQAALRAAQPLDPSEVNVGQPMEADALTIKEEALQPSSTSPTSSSNADEPTDLTMDADEKERLRDRLRREHFLASARSAAAEHLERDREESLRHPAAATNGGGHPFDFRLLTPQVSLKTE